MKKLMFACALAASAAFAFGAETSSLTESDEIVGFCVQDLVNRAQGVGVTFTALGKEGTMADLTVSGYDGMYCDGQIYCGKLNTFGCTIKKMFWIDYTEGDVTWYGWYNADGTEEYNDEPLAPGEGLWFHSPSGEYKVTSAGGVCKEQVQVALINGAQLCPNPTPVTLKMGQAWIADYGNEYADGRFYCGKLNTFGCTIKKMFWIDYTEGNVTWYGWYNADGTEEYNDVELAPGEALWVHCPADGWSLNWPSALNPDAK